MKLPPLVDCYNPLCTDGWCKSLPCAICNGLSKTLESGDPVPPEVVIPYMRQVLARQRAEIRRLRAKLPPPELVEPDRYGDAKKAFGGVSAAVYRGD